MGYYGGNNGSYSYQVADADGDTRVTVERTADDDTVRLDIGGATPIVDALTIDQASGFHWNTNGDDLDFKVSTQNETDAVHVIGSEDATAFGHTTAQWTRNGATVQSRALIKKEDEANRNANAYLLETDTLGRAPDLTFLRRNKSDSLALSSSAGLGAIRFDGWDGAEYQSAAQIVCDLNTNASLGDVRGRYLFQIFNAGVAQTYQSIEADGQITLGTGFNNGAHVTVPGLNNQIQFQVRAASTQTANLVEFQDNSNVVQHLFGATGAVTFNEQGNAADFRVESDDDPNAVNISGANDSVAFGTANHSLQINGLTVTPKVHVIDSAGDTNISFVVRSAEAIATQGAFMVAARSRGTDGSETAVVDGDRGLVFRSDMHDGTQFITAGSISCSVEGTPSTGIVGGQWNFSTNDGVGGGNTTKMTLRADGKLGIGTSAPFSLIDVRGSAIFNYGKLDADFTVWGVTAAAIFHDASTARLRFGANATGDLLELWTTKTEWNRTNLDINYNIRTTGDNNTFFVDGGTDRVGIKTSAPTSTFGVNGSFGAAYVAKTATYTATEANHTIDCTANSFTVTLPTAVGITGRIYNVKNSGTGTITLDGNGTETIDGSLTAAIATTVCLTVQSTGANWIII
jgi:hypothetical protein